jgi:hypothetical protein
MECEFTMMSCDPTLAHVAFLDKTGDGDRTAGGKAGESAPRTASVRDKPPGSPKHPFWHAS